VQTQVIRCLIISNSNVSGNFR